MFPQNYNKVVKEEKDNPLIHQYLNHQNEM